MRSPSGKVYYYWRPGRGTEHGGQSVRLPDNPNTARFWSVVEAHKKPVQADLGGMARMIDAYQASPHYGQLKPTTRREYDRYMREVRDHLGKFTPDALGPSEVASLRDQLGKTPAKANAMVKAIAALYRWGRELGHARQNPAERIRLLKTGEHQPWPDWAWALTQAYFRPELRLACNLALYTGQRLGDVLRMQLGDIKGDSIIVRQAKTGKTLQIPLHSDLMPLVEECRSRGTIYLVAKRDGQPLTTDHFHAMWTREVRRQELRRIRAEKVVFHGLRKSATVRLAEVGCSEKEIASITGMSMAMVQHYSKGADQKRLARQAMRKLEDG